MKTSVPIELSEREAFIAELALRELLYLCEEGGVFNLVEECGIDERALPTLVEVAAMLDRINTLHVR